MSNRKEIKPVCRLWVIVGFFSIVLGVLVLLMIENMNIGWIIDVSKLNKKSTDEEIKMAVLAPIVYICFCVQMFSSLPENLHDALVILDGTDRSGHWIIRLISEIIQICLAILLLVLGLIAWYETGNIFGLIRVLSGEL